MAVLCIGVMTAIVKVWLPIIYDGLGFLGKESEAPEWLEAEGLKTWLIAAICGFILFAIGIVAGHSANGLIQMQANNCLSFLCLQLL